ncbi:MAG: hypothetical protein K0S71_2740 [Clostridia bacterium]|jgi:hypothetical protein|nr:hypothetical protein [Clostridia bacterium]
MEDIIKQIIQIDSTALNTKHTNEESLRLKREHYEEQMKIYKEDVLKKANARAEELYNQIVESGMGQYKIEEEKSKQAALLIENRYLQIEDALLDKIFSELFMVEG